MCWHKKRLIIEITTATSAPVQLPTPTDSARSPWPKADDPPSQVTAPSRHDVLAVGHPFGQFGHLAQPCSLPLPSACRLLGGAWERGKKIPWRRINTTWQNTKPSVCYQQHSYSKSKTQPCNSYWGKINSTLAVTRGNSWELLFKLSGTGAWNVLFVPLPMHLNTIKSILAAWGDLFLTGCPVKSPTPQFDQT